MKGKTKQPLALVRMDSNMGPSAPVVSKSDGFANHGANAMSTGGLVAGHKLPKLIARVQLPVGAFCEERT